MKIFIIILLITFIFTFYLSLFKAAAKEDEFLKENLEETEDN